MSNFSIKQRYVLYQPAASLRAQYKLIHICQKSQRIFLSLNIVSFRFYTTQPGSTRLRPSINFCDEQSDLFVLMNENYCHFLATRCKLCYTTKSEQFLYF